MTREERIAQVAPLRAQGLTYAQIAERLGVSRGTVARCFSEASYESTLYTSREAKRRRTGTCEDCGNPTRYNGRTTNGASRYCEPCGHKRQGLMLRGIGLTGEVLAYLSEPRRYSELRARFNLSEDYISQMLYQRLLPRGDVIRLSRGVYQRADNGR
jgi:hypothetical protein